MWAEHRRYGKVREVLTGNWKCFAVLLQLCQLLGRADTPNPVGSRLCECFSPIGLTWAGIQPPFCCRSAGPGEEQSERTPFVTVCKVGSHYWIHMGQIQNLFRAVGIFALTVMGFDAVRGLWLSTSRAAEWSLFTYVFIFASKFIVL